MQKGVTFFRILSYQKRHILYHFYIEKSGTMWVINRYSELKNPDLPPYTKYTRYLVYLLILLQLPDKICIV